MLDPHIFTLHLTLPNHKLRAQVVTSALRHLATRLIAEAATNLSKAAGGRLTFEGPAWNANTVSMVR